MTYQSENYLDTSRDDAIERIKKELYEGAKKIGKQFDDGEIDAQEYKKKVLELIDRVTNPAEHE